MNPFEPICVDCGRPAERHCNGCMAELCPECAGSERRDSYLSALGLKGPLCADCLVRIVRRAVARLVR